MIFNSITAKTALLVGGLVLATGVAMAPHPADARVYVGIGVGGPLFYGPGYYGPGPYYYGPPVVYAPPPVVYAPQPQVTYINPPRQSYYYCDNPQGYYPNVQSCSTAWREVPATPARAGR